MKTNRFAELLSIRYPIFQAPIGRTAPPELAAAVTNAGGLGMLGTNCDKPDVTMREKIRATRALTGGAFAVNLAMRWDQHERLDLRRSFKPMIRLKFFPFRLYICGENLTILLKDGT